MDVLHLLEFNTQSTLHRFFIHYQAALNNDRSRFCSLQEETTFWALIKIFYLVVD